MGFFRVVALDLDGTLTSSGALSPAAMAAVAGARADGLTVVLVTGRIRAELEAEFPGVGERFDALVVENGAVVVVAGRSRALAPPPDLALTELLAARGVPFRLGDVLLAVDGTETGEVAAAIAELELDYQVVHNRAAAMVLPAGVTKGTGLAAALAELNLSPHNTVAVGDAENDLSMLQTAEVGAAVTNAVRTVRGHADLVLDGEDGDGVAGFLTGPLLAGARRCCPPRRWVEVGSYDDGTPARVPGSQGRVLVTGPSGAGKSYVVGLLAERWVLAGYSLLVVDPEGDHVGLEEMGGVRVVDAVDHLPTPLELVSSLLHPLSSVVLDLSGLVEADKVAYVRRLASVGRAQRQQHGIPHWVLFDEAHLRGGRELDAEGTWTPQAGYVLSSFMPALLPIEHVDCADVVIDLGDGYDAAGLGFGAARRGTLRLGSSPPRAFTVAVRRTPHVRHRHKYADVQLPAERRFYFHVREGAPVVAGTLHEFRTAVRQLDPEVLEYHLQRGDLSRWLEHTIADRDLATEVAGLEADLAARRAADVERARSRIVQAVGERYLHERPGTGSGGYSSAPEAAAGPGQSGFGQ
ncbi:MAG: HAD-IIB family hydrolase [Nocardioidaceae bacterium]